MIGRMAQKKWGCHFSRLRLTVRPPSPNQCVTRVLNRRDLEASFPCFSLKPRCVGQA